MSRVRGQVSGVTIYIYVFVFLDKEAELVGGGSVINGASPSSFYVCYNIDTFLLKVLPFLSMD